jgi:hypothetical protein
MLLCFSESSSASGRCAARVLLVIRPLEYPKGRSCSQLYVIKLLKIYRNTHRASLISRTWISSVTSHIISVCLQTVEDVQECLLESCGQYSWLSSVLFQFTCRFSQTVEDMQEMLL